MATKIRIFAQILLLIFISLLGSTHAKEVRVTGAGATFPYPLIAEWASAYHKETGAEVNYQGIGSMAGIKRIRDKVVDFAATDVPLKPFELNRLGLIQFPATLGGIVPIVNLPGIKPGEMKLSGEALVGLFMGEIKRWNDPVIQNLNPGLNLPDEPVYPIVRNDGSGTTYYFTEYLSRHSSLWRLTVGVGQYVNWPQYDVSLRATGNEGVTTMVARMKGAIGYVEFAYAISGSQVAYTQLRNPAGNFVSPAWETFRNALDQIHWENENSWYQLMINLPGENSWPITAATFILMYERQTDPNRTQALIDFFQWAVKKGDPIARQLHFVSSPPKAQETVRRLLRERLIDKEGNPLGIR